MYGFCLRAYHTRLMNHESDTNSVNPRFRPRIAALISGGGRTVLNMADAVDRGDLDAELALVVSSRLNAPGVERCRARGMRTEVVSRKEYDSVESFSASIWAHIRESGANLVCLSGFLSLLTIPDDFDHRVLNIHPALLPKFGGKGMYGKHVHQAVIDAGEVESGCTVHYANAVYDSGQIILQKRCPVLPGDTSDTLAARVFELECEAYPEAIRQVSGTV